MRNLLRVLNGLFAVSLPGSAIVALLVFHHATRPVTAYAAVAIQATPPTPDQDPGAWIRFIVWAFDTKAWAPLAGALLMAVMWGLRKLWDEEHWTNTDRGGATLVLLLGVLGSLSTLMLTPGVHLTAESIVTCILTAVLAAGGYTIIKKIVRPSDAGVIR